MRYIYKILHLKDVHTDANLAANELPNSNINFDHFVVDNERDYLIALDNYAPDIILCDHSLAAFNSNEALKLFKEKKLKVPFILVTAIPGDEVALNIFKDGADDQNLKEGRNRFPNVVVNSKEKYRLEQEHDKLKEETEIKVQGALKYAQDLSDKLLLATKTAGIGIWDYSFDNKLFVADEVLLKHYNLTPAEFKGDYLELVRYIHPDDQTGVLQNFHEAFSNHSVVNTEFRIIWQDGSTRFLKAVALIQRDEVGNLVRLIGTHQDVTADKKSEQVLRESECRLVEAQSVTKVGSWETDLSNLKVIWSLETCRIFEISPEESDTSHQNFLGFVHPDDRDRVDAAFMTSLSTHTVNNIEHRIVTSSGTIKTVEERWRVVSDDKGRPLCTRGTIQDITERKQAQRLIIESEAKVVATFDELQQTLNDLNNIMDSSIDIICTIDEEGKFRKVSAASERILGYKPDELKGKKFIDFVYYQDVEMTIGVAQQISSGAPVTMFENRYVQKNGNVVPILWSARYNNNDKLMYCIAKDASEKKRLEKAFEEERKRFLKLFVQAPFAMGILKGPNYIMEMVNHHYLKLIRKKDVLGKSFSEARPELVEQGFIGILDEVYTTGETFMADEKLVRIDSNDNGKLIDSYLNLIYQAYRNNEGIIEGIFFFAVDVTEHVLSRRKIEESEKKLAKSESSLKRAQALADIGNWEIDLADNRLIWSDELYKIFELNKEDVIPSPELFLSIIHPADRRYVKQQILKSSKYLTGVSFEYRLIKTDDSVKYCYTESRFEFDKDNKPVRLYGIMQDITVRKLAEIERTKMIKDIIQRNKELEQFTYIVSHNLRAPVANIIGFADALNDQAFSQSLQKEFLSQLSVSVSKLDDVIRDLNNVLLVKQKVNDVKEQISLSMIVENIKISIRNLIEQYEVTIETDFSEVESINSIKTFVHSILYNLISNSIKYRSPGNAPVISIRTHRTAERFELVFSDNGLGIDMKKNHEKVFGLYKRFHLNIEGKGLGLFMTKSQIETLGGTIEVSSEIHNGTTFKIYLPSSTIVF